MLLKAIAFDLDGTLVDSAPDIAHALDVALRREGLPGFDLSTVRGWIGDGPDVLIARALATCGAASKDPAVHSRLRAAFDAATMSTPLVHGGVYDGIEAMLAQLKDRLSLLVVTNRPAVMAAAVLSAAGLQTYFSAVFGADTHAQRKPAPLMLEAAALQLGLDRRHLLMVGDSPADLQSARAAGCPAVLVNWGYGGAHVPPDPGLRRLDTPGELTELLKNAAL